MSEPLTVTFHAPDESMNLNQRWHWAKQARVTRRWRDTAAYAAVVAARGIPLPLGPSTIRTTIAVYGRLRRDPANYTPTVKACVDGLVDAGLWPDDTPDWVETIEPRLRVIQRGMPQTIDIEITPRNQGAHPCQQHDASTAAEDTATSSTARKSTA